MPQLATAIDTAHQQGVVHRDLKPANILLAEGDQAKITDFGLAKMLETDQRQTQSGDFLGTPSYAAPEQVRGQISKISPATDVYPLGSILYELLTGRPPFQGVTMMETLTLVVNQEPVAPRLLNPSVPRDLETICLKCLRKPISDRYESAEMLGDDLQRFLRHEPIVARPVGSLERFWKWSRRHPALVALMLVSLVMLTALAAYLTGLKYQKNLERSAEQEKKARIAADEAREAADVANERYKALYYSTKMTGAHRDWKQARIPRMLASLESQLPSKTGRDFRGFEWYYLWTISHGDTMRVPCRLGYALNHNGSTLATLDKDRHICVHDGRSGRLLRKTEPLSDFPLVFRFLPNSDTLMVWLGDSSMELIDAQTGKRTKRVDHKLGFIDRLTLSENRKLAAALTPTKQARIWEVESGKVLHTISDKRLLAQAIAFTPDEKHLLCAGQRGSVLRIEVSSGKVSEFIQGGRSIISQIRYSPDGKWLALLPITAKTVEIRNASTNQVVRQLDGHTQSIYGFAFNSDGRLLVTASQDNTALVWDVASGMIVQKIRGHTRGKFTGVVNARFHPDGNQVVTRGMDELLRFWPLGRDPECRTLFAGGGRDVRSLAFSPDGKLLASGGWDNKVLIHDQQDTQALPTPLFGDYSSLAFSPDGKHLAGGAGHSAKAHVWEVATKKKLYTISRTGAMIQCVDYSPDGTILAVSGSDQKISFHDAKTGTELRRIDTQTFTFQFAFHPNKELLAVTGHLKLLIFNWKTGVKVLEKTVQKSLFSIAYSPDGKHLIVSGPTDDVVVYDAQSGEIAYQLEGHIGMITAAIFSPDGKRAITGALDQKVKIWDVETRQEVLSLDQHRTTIRSLAISRDGLQIASGAQGVIKIYDARKGYRQNK